MFFLYLHIGSVVFADQSGNEYADLDQAIEAASVVAGEAVGEGQEVRIEVSDDNDTLLASVMSSGFGRPLVMRNVI